MFNSKHKSGLLIGLVLLTTLLALPDKALAQWPPFKFGLASSYADGKITYLVQFSKQVDWPMSDVVIKIPLPEGTRFVEASAPPSTSVGFDGAEITFFSPTLHRSLNDTYFVVEVIDPARTEYTTHAWIAWKGEQPGDYLTGEEVIDITRTPLVWEKSRSRLRLEAGATVVDDVITYMIYPTNVGGRRMWDLTITVPIPDGTTFLSVEAPSPFEAGFDGQQAVFSALELARRVKVGPLQVRVSTTGLTDPFVVTQAWAGWNNVGRNVAMQEQTKTGDIIVQPHAVQLVVADAIADAPFANYDLTGIAFEAEETAFKMTFQTAGEMGPIGEPLEHYLYLDADCNTETGKPRGNRGAEFWVRYRHQNGKGYLYNWDPVASTWSNRRTISAFPSTGNLATVWIPRPILDATGQFCWVAVSRNRTEAYHPNPPVDWVGIDPRLTQYP